MTRPLKHHHPASIMDDEAVLVSRAGGAVDGLSTPTSDTDILALCPASVLPQLQVLLGAQARLDLEHQEPGWFTEIEERLAAHAVSAFGGLSPFTILDLRFLVRLALGEVLFESLPLRTRLERLREPLRHAAAELVSTRFVSCYEDVAGFMLAGRPELAALLAGELVQSACLLALLQVGLVDLSPKWAVARCLRSTDATLASAASSAAGHLTAGQAGDAQGWGLGLLHHVNRILASGVCAGRGWTTEPPDNPAAGPAVSGIPWCLMGLVGQLTCSDVQANRILFVNQHYVTALAGGDPEPNAQVVRLEFPS